MDLDWCLNCNGRLDDSSSAYCSLECQRADYPSNYHCREIEIKSRPKFPGHGFHDVQVLTARVPLQEIELPIEHSRRLDEPAGSSHPRQTFTAARILPVSHRPPDLVQPSSLVPPSLTKQVSTSAPSCSNLQSSQELLAAVSRSRSPERPPISLLLSTVLGIARLQEQTETNSHGPVSRSHRPIPRPKNPGTGHCQSLRETRSLQRVGWTPSSQETLTTANTQSTLSTLVETPSFQILSSKTDTRVTKANSLNPMLEEVRTVSMPLDPNGSAPPGPSIANDGFFSHSHHFVLPNANMSSIGTQHQHYYHGHTSALDRLTKCTMPGAELNSSLREYPPRCHPGTRSSILAAVRNFIRREEVKLIRISGPAGAGKSAIIQTLAESSRREHLYAALFLSKKDEIDDARRLFPTIAYQLAVQNEAYLAHLEEKFTTDPLFLDKSLSAQFQSLVVAPFVQKRVLSGPERCIIFVDALDDFRAEQDQLQILRLVHELTLSHTALPLTWVFTTRPKPHLTTFFAQIKRKQTSYRELHLFVDSEQARRDVQCYLEAEFKRIKDSFPETIPSSACWPTKDQFRSIASSSFGFFAFASSIIHFIGNPTGDPFTRLRRVVTSLDDGGGSKMISENPFRTLDAMYTEIMSEIPADNLPNIKLILGYYLAPVKSFRHETSLLLAYNLLGVERCLDSILRMLLPVMTVPSASGAQDRGLRFLHNSFARYLQDQERSNVYCIDLNEVLTRLWRRCSSIFLQWSECCSSHIVQISYAPSDTVAWSKSRGDLREELFQTASSLWADLLCQYCHRWCSGACPIKNDSPFCLTIAACEILDVIHQLDFGNPVFFSDNSVYLARFLSWLLEHAPIELRNQVVLQEFNLSTLSKPRFFKALCDKKWYRGTTKRHECLEAEVDKEGLAIIRELPVSEWFIAEASLAGARGSLGDLVRLIQGAYTANSIVTIFGTSSFSCCGLVHHQKSPSTLQYHIFPYSDTSSYATSLTMCSLD